MVDENKIELIGLRSTLYTVVENLDGIMEDIDKFVKSADEKIRKIDIDTDAIEESIKQGKIKDVNKQNLFAVSTVDADRVIKYWEKKIKPELLAFQLYVGSIKNDIKERYNKLLLEVV